ncbi:SEA (Seh1-associated) complex subunit, partial [Irineochytrium annulatum]
MPSQASRIPNVPFIQTTTPASGAQMQPWRSVSSQSRLAYHTANVSTPTSPITSSVNHRDAGALNASTTISHLQKRSKSIRYKLGTPINVLTASPDGRMAGVAGRDALKVLRVSESGIEEAINLRAGLKQSQQHVPVSHQQQHSSRSGAQFGCTDMQWGNAFSPNTIISANKVGFDYFGVGYSHFRKRDVRSRANSRATFEGKAEGVRDVQFSPVNPNEFIAVFENGSVQKWDIRRPNEVERRVGSHSGQALTVDWNPDGCLVASAGRDRIIKVWDTKSESRKAKYHIQTMAHVARVRWRPGYATASGIGSRQVANSALLTDQRILVWDLSRPYVPDWAVEEHEGLVTAALEDFLWISPTVMWSVSKDRNFIRQDLNEVGFCPSALLPTCAVAWNVFGDITLAVPKVTTPPTPNSASAFNRDDVPTGGKAFPFPPEVTPYDVSASGMLPPVPPPPPPKRTPTPTPPVASPGLMNSSSTVGAKSPAQKPGSSRYGGMAGGRGGLMKQMCILWETAPDALNHFTFNVLAHRYDVANRDLWTVCAKNAEAAADVHLYRTAQTWRILQFLLGTKVENDGPRNLTKLFNEAMGTPQRPIKLRDSFAPRSHEPPALNPKTAGGSLLVTGQQQHHNHRGLMSTMIGDDPPTAPSSLGGQGSSISGPGVGGVHLHHHQVRLRGADDDDVDERDLISHGVEGEGAEDRSREESDDADDSSDDDYRIHQDMLR